MENTLSRPRSAFMEKAFFCLYLLCLNVFAFSACNEENDIMSPDPHDASRIEGKWVDMTGNFAPDWHYHFQRGLVTQEYIKAGAVLSSLTYPYAIREDSVFIGGDATNAPRLWLLNFECDDVVEVVQSSSFLGQRFWLKKEP